VSQLPLKPLHFESSLSQVKLAQYDKLSTQELVDTLKPGQPGSLKARPDGTIVDGHHRMGWAIRGFESGHLCVFPVARSSYPQSARDEMLSRVLPRLRDWLREKQAQPETAVLGHKQVIAEWTGETHRLHEMRFL